MVQNEMQEARETYAGFIAMAKYGMVAVALVVALVLYLIT